MAGSAATFVDALDRYADGLWQVKLPTSCSPQPSVIRLVWLTAGLSVEAPCVAVGDYASRFPSAEIARRAHLCIAATETAVQALEGAGLLVALARERPGTCLGVGYRLHPERGSPRVSRSP